MVIRITECVAPEYVIVALIDETNPLRVKLFEEYVYPKIYGLQEVCSIRLEEGGRGKEIIVKLHNENDRERVMKAQIPKVFSRVVHSETVDFTYSTQQMT